jgi:hypothetical protein
VWFALKSLPTTISGLKRYDKIRGLLESLDQDPPQILIRKAEISDIPQIKLLMESVFGTFTRMEEMFTKWITHEQYSVQIAVENENIVGVSTWSFKLDDDYSHHASFGEYALSYLRDKKSAWVVNLAIALSLTNQGYGRKLCLAHIDWLRNARCEVIVGTSWVNGSEDNSQHLYLKSGFEKLGESKEFMRGQMELGGTCAICKTAECHCKSIFFGVEAEKLIRYMRQTS